MTKKIKNKNNTMKIDIKDISSTKKKIQIEINAEDFNVLEKEWFLKQLPRKKLVKTVF